MRLLAVALLLCLSLPAWAAGPSLSAQDEARLIYLEKRVGELDAQNRELRAYAEKAADGPKAELTAQIQGAKDVAAAQVQGVKESLNGQFQGLSSNFNMLATVLLAAFGALVGFNVFSYFNARREVRALAKDEAAGVAEARMVTMEGELKTKVAKLEQGLEAKEREILKSVQAKADGVIGEMEAAKQKGYALARDMEVAKQQGDAHVEALAKNRTRSDEITAELVNLRSPPASTPEGERLEAETRNTPPQDLTEDQLTGLTKQALAKGKPGDAARYVGALAGKKQEDPYALILLARSRREQGLLDEAIDAARGAVEVAHKRNDYLAEGIAQCELGDALLDDHKGEAAKAAFAQYRDILAALVSQDSTNTDWRRELGVAWSRLGDVAQEEGNCVAAKAAFAQFRDIFASLSAQDSANTDWQENMGKAWSRLGDVALDDGNRMEADAAFTQSRNIFTALAERDSASSIWWRELGLAWSRLGEIALEEGNWAEAKRASSQFHAILAGLVAKDESNVDWQQGLESAQRQCARVALAEGEFDDAEDLLRQAESIIEALKAKDSKNPLYLRDKAWLRGVWGDWHASKGEACDARHCWGEAVTELEDLEQAKILNFFGRRVLKQYRAKLVAA